MIPRTNVLYSIVGLNAADTTATIYQTQRERQDRPTLPVSISITAGTATVAVEGRTSAQAAWVVIGSVTANGIVMVPAGLQIRIHPTAAAGATIEAETDLPLKVAL